MAAIDGSVHAADAGSERTIELVEWPVMALRARPISVRACGYPLVVRSGSFCGWLGRSEGRDLFDHFEEFGRWFRRCAEFERSPEGVSSSLSAIEHGFEAVINVSDVGQVEDELGDALVVDEIGENSIELLTAEGVEFVVGSNDGGAGHADGHR